MMTQITIESTALESELRNELRGLAEQPGGRMKIRQLVKTLIPEIRAAMRQGHQLAAILEMMHNRSNGVLKPHTVRGYIYGKDSVLNDPDVQLPDDDPLLARARARRQP